MLDPSLEKQELSHQALPTASNIWFQVRQCFCPSIKHLGIDPSRLRIMTAHKIIPLAQVCRLGCVMTPQRLPEGNIVVQPASEMGSEVRGQVPVLIFKSDARPVPRLPPIQSAVDSGWCRQGQGNLSQLFDS